MHIILTAEHTFKTPSNGKDTITTTILVKNSLHSTYVMQTIHQQVSLKGTQVSKIDNKMAEYTRIQNMTCFQIRRISGCVQFK